MKIPDVLQTRVGEKTTVYHGLAWMALCLALTIHVIDEAMNDFLSLYNSIVQNISNRLPFLPLPTFTFETWLTGLVLVIVVLLALTPFSLRGARWMTPLSYVFGILMFANGALHILGSFYLDRWLPGVYSAPLLLAASTFLLVRTHLRQSSVFRISDRREKGT